MKKLFAVPEVEVVTFDSKDVITTSNCPEDSCSMDLIVRANDTCDRIFYEPTCDDWV